MKQVLIDGQPLPVATIASGSHYCRTDSKWSVCADDSFMYYERSAANGGPGAQTLYSGRIIAVYGTLGGSAATQALRTLAVNTANALFAQIKLLVTIVPDTDFNFADVSSASSSILLFGGPSLNSMSSLVIKGGAASGCMVSSTFARAVAFTAGDASVAIGPEVYGEPGYGFTGFGSVNITCGGTDSYRDQKLESPLLAQLSASPLSPPVPFVRIPGQSLALLFAGADINGVSDAVSQADVGQSNSVLPDYIVTTPSTRWKGVGGLLAAGFWGNSWEWRADLSYSTDPSE